MDATTSAQIIEYYRDLATNQSNYYNTMVTWLSSFFVIFTGSAFIWNLKMVKKEIKERVSEEVEEKIKDIEEKNIKEIEEKVLLFKEEMKYENVKDEARYTRMFGGVLYNLGLYRHSFGWLTISLEQYIKINNGKKIRIIVENLLNIAEKHGDAFIGFDNKSKIKNYIASIKKIDNILNEEKEKLLDFLENVKKQKLKKKS